MKKIFLTRHGETTANQNFEICGQREVELTIEGVKQAYSLSDELKSVRIDEVISSPLNRARDTAKIIAESKNIPLRVDDRIKEFDFGSFDGLYVEDNTFLSSRSNFACRFEGGESVLDAAQRVYNLLDELIKDDKVYLLVCHNAIARVVNSYFSSLSNEEFFHYQIHNCQLMEYEV